MAKPNYQFAKRQLDLAKKEKKEQKRLKKAVPGEPGEIHSHAGGEKHVQYVARFVAKVRRDLQHVLARADNSLRQQEAGGQFVIVPRRATPAPRRTSGPPSR